MSTCTVRPVFVVVAAARLTASPMERSGTPLQLRVICEKALCSMALELPPSQKEDNRVGIRILHLQPCFPYLFDVVAHELGSVVAGAYRHVARVLGDIIDTVRDYLRLGEGLEVMVERLGLPHTKRLPLTLEVADKFLLLGVDTQNGKPELGAFLPDLGDVSVGGGHPASYLRDGQRHPEDILVLRETGKVRLYDETERVHPFGMERQPGLAPAPGTADATLSRSVPGTEFPDALADRIFTMSLRHLC